MGDDDEYTVSTISKYRNIITGLVEKHEGRVVDSPGDNILAEFSSALNSVNSAIEIQSTLEIQNRDLPENRRMDFRIARRLRTGADFSGTGFQDPGNKWNPSLSIRAWHRFPTDQKVRIRPA